MGWFLAAAVFLLTAALALRSSSPGKAIAIAISAVVAVLVALGLFLLGDPESDRRATIVPAEQIALSDTKTTSDRYGHQLSGMILNRSARRLGTVTLRVTYRDCPSPQACVDVGSETQRVFLALPPGQATTFSVALTRAGATARNDLTWSAVVVDGAADF